MKKMFLLFACLVLLGKNVYGQIEFIDFASVGGEYKIPSEDNGFFKIILPDYFFGDYAVGALFHRIDLATLLNFRANLKISSENTSVSDIMIGGQFEYFGFNLFGFGLGGGIALNKERNFLPYIKASAFFHLISTMKITMDFGYKSYWYTGISISIPLVSGFFRGNNVQYSNLKTNKNIIGKWTGLDEEIVITIEFIQDKSFEYIIYLDGEIGERRYGYFSTGEIFGINGMRMVYTDGKRNEGVGFEYKLNENTLTVEINGRKINLERIE
jgi:hypothetical protein